MKSPRLGKDFFERSVLTVAKEMLGKKICVSGKNGEVARMVINETEAYDGEKDLACHASKGKTPRNEVMYGDAGVIYMYLCYGMHWLLNIVCGEKGYPAAVLLRGTQDISGPGRLTKKLGLNGDFNRKVANPSNGLWFEDGIGLIRPIQSGSRIGIDYAGKYWSSKPYRFWFSNE